MKTHTILAIASVLTFAVHGFAQSPAATHSASTAAVGKPAPQALSKMPPPRVLRHAPTPTSATIDEALLALKAMYEEPESAAAAGLIASKGPIDLYSDLGYLNTFEGADFTAVLEAYRQEMPTVSF